MRRCASYSFRPGLAVMRSERILLSLTEGRLAGLDHRPGSWFGRDTKIGSQMMTSQRFWPFERKYAWWASVVLLPASIATAIGLQAAGRLPGRQAAWWVLLGAVVIGLLPVILMVLGGVTTVKAAGVEVTFAAVQRAVYAASEATVRSTLSDNLGAPPGALLDTSGETIIQALRAAVTNDVVVVSLGDGHEWWDTRLLLLIAGATRLGHPRAIAFTATRAGKPGQYLGWATPADLLRTQLSRSSQWREAYRLAQRNALLAVLAKPEGTPPTPRLPWSAAGRQRIWGDVPENLTALAATAPGGPSLLPWPSPDGEGPPMTGGQGLDDPYLAERFLKDQLSGLENPQEPRQRELLELTIARVEDLFAPVLHCDAIDTQDAEKLWFDGILNGTASYVAVTSAGQLASLVPRDVAINAVLRSLISDRSVARPDRSAAPKGAAPGGES